MGGQIHPLLAFSAGILSFLSPCIIPIIPSYLTFICGTSLQSGSVEPARLRIVGRTAFFALGFSLVFAALGLLLSGIGSALGRGSRVVSYVSGALIVAFGLNVIFDFWRLLDREKKVHLSHAPRGFGGALVAGMAFGAGWTPCVGPILASILLAAGASGSLERGSLLLLAYSLGLGLPFLLTSIFVDPLMRRLARIRRHLPAIRIASGAFLVLLGALVILGRLQRLNSWLFRFSGILHAWSLAAPLASRLLFAAMFALGTLALLAGILRRVLRHGALPPIRSALAAILAALAALTSAGVIDIPALLVAWLSFRGL